MRIKRIELRGFKSFADATVFQFGPGIAAVVGPNGCGKSNLIDAIRWTLGEQSPGTLRGRAMSDVIFAGSEVRRPANRAEVSVVFDISDGAFGGRYRRYEEIEVSRVLERSGESSYTINRERSRLKDVTGLFLDTGVGARAYSIIEQGRVGFFVNAKPEERRVLIDEVAGINRFKAQKFEAERRLAETRTNLVRVADLTQELRRERDGLAAQAERAEQFLSLRRSWRRASVTALAAEALGRHVERSALQSTVESLAQQVRGLEEEEEGVRATLAASVSAAEAARTRCDELEGELADLNGRAAAADRERGARVDEAAELRRRLDHAAASLEASKRQIADTSLGLARATEAAELERGRFKRGLEQRETADLGDARAREEAVAARHRVEAQKAIQLDLMMRATRHGSAIKLLRRRIVESEAVLQTETSAGKDTEQRLGAAGSAVAGALSALGEARSARARLVVERDTAHQVLVRFEEDARAAREALRAADSLASRLQERVRAERAVIASLTGFQPGVRELVAWLVGDGNATSAGREYVGIVADLLEVPAASEVEVEHALGVLVGALVFRTREGQIEATEWLARRDLGSVSLLVASGPGDAQSGLARGVRDLGCPGLAQQLLGDVDRYARVADLPAGGSVRHGVSGRTTAVDGVLTVGTTTAISGGQIGRRTELRAVEEKQVSAAAAHAERATELNGADERVQTASVERDRLSGATHAAELAELAARRDLEEAERQLITITTETERSHARMERERHQAGQAQVELDRARSDLDGVRLEERSASAELIGRRDALRVADEAAALAASVLTTSRARAAELRHAAAIAEREVRRLQGALSTAQQALERDVEVIGAAKSRLEVVTGRIHLLVAEAGAARRQLAAVELLRDPARLERVRAAETVLANQVAIKAVLESRAAVETRRNDGLLADARSAGHLAATLDRAARDLDLDLSPTVEALAEGRRVRLTIGGGPHAPEIDVELDPDLLIDDRGGAGREAARLEKRSRELGAVNLGARGEFDLLDSRYQDLVTEKTDLESAMRDLRAALATIERETRSRFEEAFAAVARHFATLYPRLVGGGRGELVLTEPGAPLQSGIDVRVEPPGKRLQTLRLLSGGEKAMAAIAFVFAIFEVKPSPFCLLDEVDAPLDEANSRRFNAMLRELAAETQFVVITHNRTTMEVADVLYGVTMQEPGASAVVSVALDRQTL